jgi:hypothetical protein
MYQTVTRQAMNRNPPRIAEGVAIWIRSRRFMASLST